MKNNSVVAFQESDTLSDLVVAPEFAGKISIDLSVPIEARWVAAQQHAEHSKARFSALGLLLVSLKKDMPHGAFLPELERRGFEERQARRAMAYAQYVFSQPLQQQMRLLDMPVTKVATLAQADPEVVEVLMEDGDKVERTNVRGLLEEIKEKEALIERKDKAYADLETQLEMRGRELQKLSRLDPAALLTRSVRAEAVANAAALGEVCENLIRLAEAVQDESIAAEQRSLRRRAVGMAMGTALAHLQALYEALEGDLGEGIPEPTVLDDLTHEEQSLAVKCRTHMQVQFAHRVAQRREEAYAEHLAEGGQKRRGRPPKKGGV